MNNVLDTNLDIIYNSNNKEVEINSSADREITSETVNTYLRATGVNRRLQIGALNNLYSELNNHSTHFIFSNFKYIWLMIRHDSKSQLFDFVAGTSLTASGDNPITWEGISGGGTEEFDTGIVPSVVISDIDNWSMGLMSQTDDDTGVDMGCSDGVNEHSIQIKDGGQAIVKNGSSLVSDTVTAGNIHVTMSAQGGTLKSYEDGVEIGTSTAVAGSLVSTRSIKIGALNDNGVDANHSSKVYSFGWIYDGALTGNGVGIIDKIFKEWNFNQAR